MHYDTNRLSHSIPSQASEFGGELLTLPPERLLQIKDTDRLFSFSVDDELPIGVTPQTHLSSIRIDRFGFGNDIREIELARLDADSIGFDEGLTPHHWIADYRRSDSV